MFDTIRNAWKIVDLRKKTDIYIYNADNIQTRFNNSGSVDKPGDA